MSLFLTLSFSLIVGGLGYALGWMLGGKAALQKHAKALEKKITVEQHQQAKCYFDRQNAVLQQAQAALAEEQARIEAQKAQAEQWLQEAQKARQSAAEASNTVQVKLQREQKRRQNAVYAAQRQKAKVKKLQSVISTSTEA